MTRRSALQTIPAGLAAAQAGRAAPASAGRLKQSLARWCYARIPLDDLCRQAAAMGVSGIDLVEPADWPTIRKYGLVPTITQGDAKIPDGWNRKESHDRLEQEIRGRIMRAAKANVVTVGMGMPVQEKWVIKHMHDLPPARYMSVGAHYAWSTQNRKRGPAWATDNGLEWLFRLLYEPRRMWRRIYARWWSCRAGCPAWRWRRSPSSPTISR